ncbi:MAG: hypothetical protein FWF41_03120 [Betaproteobacteria bacterium]|nr:hypothetical protein [Betaproteobacteria bacterium]
MSSAHNEISFADQQRLPLTHGLFLLLLMGVQVWAGYHSVGIYDTHRDLYFAQSIVQGAELPLNGPAIYGKMHLGPLWFYLLALPLWLFDNAVAVPVTTAFLGALKYPLAYVLGRHFGGSRLGLLFAAACLFPGWSSFTLLALTHSTVVETALLAGALTTLFYRRKTTAGAAVLLGLMVGLMFHAHPTTLILAAAMVFLALINAQGWKKRLGHLGIVGLVSFLFLTPMLIGQALHGFPDLPTLTLYGKSEPSWPSLQRMEGLLTSLLFYGGGYVARFWLEWPLLWCKVFLWALGGTLFWVLIGVVRAVYRNPARRRWIVALLIALLVQTAYVMMLRSITPFWMVFAHLPILAALCAIGLEEGVGIKKIGRPLTAVTLVFWVGVSLAGALLFLGRGPYDVFIDTPSPGRQGLMNISDIEPLGEGQRIMVARISFDDLYRIGEKLCQPVTLYGHYAGFVDESFGVGATRYCLGKDQIALGGRADPITAWIGLRDYAWAQIGLEPEEWLGTLGIIRPETTAGNPQPLPIGNPHLYPPHNESVATETFEATMETLPGRAVLISARLGRVKIKEAWLGETPISAAYEDSPGTFVFVAPQSQNEEGLRWRFVLAGDPRYIDVVSFVGKRK